MKVAIFSTREYEKSDLENANNGIHELKWIAEPLNALNAAMAKGCDAAIVFINDEVDNTKDVVDALKSGRIGFLGLDVYEFEKNVFFEDLSSSPPKDPLLKYLIEQPNVLITSHHAFLTENALKHIARTTFDNINCWAKGLPCKNELT